MATKHIVIPAAWTEVVAGAALAAGEYTLEATGAAVELLELAAGATEVADGTVGHRFYPATSRREPDRFIVTLDGTQTLWARALLGGAADLVISET